MWRLIFSLLLASAAWGQTNHPILAVGSAAPDFSLPGADGRIHRLADFAASAGRRIHLQSLPDRANV